MNRLLRIALACALAAAAGSIGRAQAHHLSLPEGHEFTSPDGQVFSIAPDGSQIVYLAHAMLYLKTMDDAAPTVIRGPLIGRDIANPVFSPDGRSIVYWARDGAVVQRVPVSGGPPITICEAVMPFGMTWGADGRLVISQGPKGVLRVPASGGPPQTIISMKAGETAQGAQILPDGDRVLFTVSDGQHWDRAQIVVQSIKSGDRKTVVATGHDARYLRSGHLVYVSAGRIVAVRFDARTLQTSGQPTVVAEGVQTAEATGTAQLSVASDGTLAYVSTRSQPLQLALVGLDGTRTLLGDVAAGAGAPRLSRNGRLAWQTDEGIYVADLANFSGARKVISVGRYPVLSPDGQWLLYGKTEDGVEKIFRQRADGSGRDELLVQPGRAPESWPDDDLFTFISHRGSEDDYDLAAYSFKEKAITPLAAVYGSAQISGSMSPDKHWLAFMSSESGDWQIYVQSFPPTSAKVQITADGGRLPMWSPDGRQLYYERDGRVFAMSVQAGSPPVFGKPAGLPVTGFIQPRSRRFYDVTPDGKQFVMLFRPGPEIDVVSNWLDRVGR